MFISHADGAILNGIELKKQPGEREGEREGDGERETNKQMEWTSVWFEADKR